MNILYEKYRPQIVNDSGVTTMAGDAMDHDVPGH